MNEVAESEGGWRVIADGASCTASQHNTQQGESEANAELRQRLDSLRFALA